MRKGLAIVAACAALASRAMAEDIIGVQPAAFDQPRVNAAVTIGGPAGVGSLLVADFGNNLTSFNIEAYLDTGASGVLLSIDTADLLGITHAQVNGQDVVYSDVGVNGSDNFNVSQQIHINIAPFSPATDIDNPETYTTVYNQTSGPIRAQIGPIGVEPDPSIGDLDVLGIPVMHNKVVVMDPRPVNSLVDTMRTHIYNPGDAAIPATSLHIKLSKGDFSPYTTIDPPGGPMPTLNANPFIGRDPTQPAHAGDPPPITVKLGSQTATGNFLLDTGAAASMISTNLAAQLHVRYVPGTFGTETPILEIYNPNNPNAAGSIIGDQFSLTIGGIGGTNRIAGFYLDSMMVPTIEGVTNANDNINFVGAPVFVNDISLRNPTDNSTLTLDGIFGMNYLVASASIIEGDPLPTITNIAFGAFDSIVYDDQNGILGLTPGSPNEVVPTKIWLGPANGGPTSTWDTSGRRWFDVVGFNINAKYVDGDDVEFSDIETNNVVIGQPVTPGSVTIDNSTDYPFTFSGQPIQGNAPLIKLGSGSVVFNNSNTYKGQTDVQSGTIIFAASQNIGPVLVESDGRLEMRASQHFDGLRLLNGRAAITSGGNKFVRVNSLEITGSGQLDIADDDLIINDKVLTNERNIRDLLRGGRNGGAWNGAGIVSSIAAGNSILYSIGYADNADLGRTVFDGEVVDGSDLLVQFTYAGDSNLDGVVDVNDLYAMASHWLSNDSFWNEGDFNYDGLVNGKDLGILARNWQVGVGNPLPGESIYDLAQTLGLPAEAVPEPASFGLLGLGNLALLRRRSRRERL